MISNYSVKALVRVAAVVLALVTGAGSAYAGSCKVTPLPSGFSPPTAPLDQFYVANRSNVVTHYDYNPTALASHVSSGYITNLAPDASIAGTNTMLALTSKNYLVGMATDDYGNLYVAEPNLNTVHVYAKPPCPSNSCLPSATPYNETPIVLRGLSQPAGLAFDRNSDLLYVANRGNNTVTAYQVNFSAGGIPALVSSPTRTFASGLSAPLGLALRGDFLYVANKGSNTIAVYRLSVTSGTPIFNKTLPYLTGPLGIAMNQAGTRLYVADNGGGVTTGASASIYKIDPTSGTPSLLAGDAQLLAGTNTGVCNPPAVAIDSSEKYLYVANRESFGGSITVYGLDQDGSLLTGSLNDPPNVKPAAIMSHDTANRLGAAVGIVFAPLP
jgi:6-phosphogluconolactonase (cycloisomerase 2 family)